MPVTDTAVPSAAQLLDLAVEAATAAGKMLRASSAAGPTTVGAKSSRTDLVSDLDRASEELIVEHIRAHRPHDSFLGEEGGAAGGAARVRWVIDPLDGTVNFLYGLPVWAVSVAAEVDGRTVAGVVHHPPGGETFTAALGGGARCNGRQLRVGSADELALALVATGFAYAASTRVRQAEALPVLLGSVRDIRRAGAAALDLCWVAAGRVDAYFETGTHVWDRAAGALIAEEAGAWVGGLDGGPASDAMVVAANPGLAGRLRRLLLEAGAGWVLAAEEP